MEIPHWENTDKWGQLRDIVNQIIDSRNAALDIGSTIQLDVIQANTDVYNSFTDPGSNWDNVTKNVYAKRNGKTVDLMVYVKSDWVSGNSSFSLGIDLKDIYKGEEDCLIMGTLITSYQGAGATVYLSVNPNGYADFDSSGNLNMSLEDGIMPPEDSAVMQLNITYQALNDISDFIS